MKNNRRDIWRVSGSLIGIVLALAVSTLFVKGAVTQPPVGSWNAGASLSQARAGASATLLPDGKILVTGGDDGSGPSNSADFINTNGTISPAPPMLAPREHHISVTLSNGKVLVAGGTTAGGGATNTAEIFDPNTNNWTSVAGGMIEARAGATATLLQNGEVLIAGGYGNNGTVSSTAEIFDPNAPSDGNPDAFTFAGNLSSPRENLAAALLNDGRVLIVGGSNGSAPLATSDIYNPSTGTMSAGPAMPTARQGLSATTLLNGLVLIAGGNTLGNNGQATDLASVELFDPSANSGAGGFGAALDRNGNPVSLLTARQGQQAVLLPHGGAVLIFGGTSSGATLASAELFTPTVSSTGAWSYADAAAGSMTASRSDFAASPLSKGTPQSIDDGILFAAGGASTDANGNVADLSSTDVYGFPWVKADQADYAPGSTANITGGGFQPGETVVLSFVESPQIDNDGPVTATADSNGKIAAQFYVDAQDAGVLFYMTAVGQSSGRRAMTTFTDANATTTTVSCVPTTVGVGQTTVCTATVTPNASQANLSGWVQWSSSNGGTFSAETGYTFDDPSGPAFPNCLLITSSSPSQGVCAVQFTPSTIGPQAITAAFYSFSQGKLTSGSSGTVTIEVAPTLVLCPPSPNPVIQGSTGPVTLEATLSTSASATCPSTSSTDALASQTITFTVDGTIVGTETTDANGNATIKTYDPSSLTAGDHTVQASFAGNTINSTLYTSATSNTETLTVLAYASVNFSSSGLPSGVSVGASATSYTNPDGTAGGPTSETFNAPGPSSSIITKPATSVSFSFPTSITYNSITYVLTALSCNSASCSSSNIGTGTGFFTDGADGTTQTVTANYVGQGKIEIVKDTTGGDGTFGFSLSGPDGYTNTASITTSGGSGTTTPTFTVNAGSGYSVTETNATNASLSDWDTSYNCGTGSVAGTSATGLTVTAGQTLTCTFTNTHKGSIKIVKDTTGGDGTFGFSLSGPNGYTNTASITTSGGIGGTTPTFEVSAGSGYSVAETSATNNSLSDWDTSYNCGGESTTGTNATGLSVTAGQTLTCTFTNTHKGSIKIVKDTTGGDGTFGFSVTGGPGSVDDTASITTSSGSGTTTPTFEVSAGSGYSVAETSATNNSLSDWDTSYNCGTGSTAGTSATGLTVTAGQTLTCTFTNTHKGSIKIVKDTTGGDGTFGFSVTGGPGSVDDTASITTSSGIGTTTPTFEVSAGSGYSVTETNATNTSLSDWDTSYNCGTGSAAGTSATGLTVTAGQTLTCTFTNTHKGSIKIVKDTTGGDGTFGFSLSGPNGYTNTASITTSSGSGTTTPTFEVSAGSGYNVTETNATNTSLSDWDTSYNCGTGSVAGTSATDLTVTAGQTLTCTFTNVKLATIVLVKDAVGGNGTFSFTSTGGLSVAPFSITTNNGTGSEMFPDVAPGASSYSFTETVPTGWVGNTTEVGCEVTVDGAGGTTIDATNATSGTVAAGGTVVSPTITSIAAGAVVTCTFTNGTLPTLTVLKAIHGTAATFFFNLNSGSTAGSTANFPANGIPVAANSTGQYQHSISTGQQTITELLDQTVAAVGGWTLTDAQCTGASGGSSTNLPSATFTANYGDNVVCTFINSNVKTTRTQGFWATHTELSNAIWNGTPLPPGTTSIPSFPVVGTGDQLLCGVPITAVAANEENQLIGGFWLQPSKTTTGKRRSKIDHDRVTMLQQYLAAVLNFHAFGGVPPGGLAPYAADYCSGNDTAIRHDIGILDTFNSQGDTNQFTPGSSATPRMSQAQADLDYWDNPAAPGSLDESAYSTSLTTVKNVSGGTASPQDFTLTATCTTTNDCGSAGKRGVLSGKGGFSSAVLVGTYSLTDAGNNTNAAGYSAGSWTCTNVGLGGTSGFLLTNGTPGTATLAIDAGAELSCSITNTHP